MERHLSEQNLLVLRRGRNSSPHHLQGFVSSRVMRHIIVGARRNVKPLLVDTLWAGLLLCPRYLKPLPRARIFQMRSIV